MRPTVEEQLRVTCRILDEIVAPNVSDRFAHTILDGLIANLRMLTAALPAVAGFLRHDNDATLGLLSALSEVLPPKLAARIDKAMAAPEPDVADGTALEERNRLLREHLAAAVCSAGLPPEMHRTIVQHMTERASRVPMRFVPTSSANP